MKTNEIASELLELFPKKDSINITRTISCSTEIFKDCKYCEKLNKEYDKTPDCYECVRVWRKELGFDF